MTQTTSLILKNDEKELGKLTEFIERFAADWDLDQEMTMKINLALEEALINVINYAYTDHLEHEISIRVSRDQNSLLLKIEDDGIPFNPLEAKEPDRNLPIEERHEGGLGIFLIKKIMSEVKYTRKADKNILLLKKEL